MPDIEQKVVIIAYNKKNLLHPFFKKSVGAGEAPVDVAKKAVKEYLGTEVKGRFKFTKHVRDLETKPAQYYVLYLIKVDEIPSKFSVVEPQDFGSKFPEGKDAKLAHLAYGMIS